MEIREFSHAILKAEYTFWFANSEYTFSNIKDFSFLQVLAVFEALNIK